MIVTIFLLFQKDSCMAFFKIQFWKKSLFFRKNTPCFLNNFEKIYLNDNFLTIKTSYLIRLGKVLFGKVIFC